MACGAHAAAQTRVAKAGSYSSSNNTGSRLKLQLKEHRAWMGIPESVKVRTVKAAGQGCGGLKRSGFCAAQD